MLDDRNSLLVRLHEVFDGVTLEDGIGLMEALEIDSHSSIEVSTIARNGDEKEDWKCLTADRLRGTFASLSYFDPKGMRFHLPAFLTAELQSLLEEDLIWQLCQVDGWCGERFSVLTWEQKRLICDILRYLVNQHRYAGQRNMITVAIDKYWGI